ncbi:MAG TPA: caspase family protein [Paracoccaceae bacterium]|nr:caspase family protein [Paracoccaceae bacterium]
MRKSPALSGADGPNPIRAMSATMAVLTRQAVLLACLSAIFFPGGAEAAGRVALVLGNAEYELQALRLANPANDARAVAGKLESLGFEVILKIDLTENEMAAAIEEFSAKAASAEMAVAFFAGHGIQLDGENYLLGTEFADLTSDALASSSATLTDFQRALVKAGPEIGVIIVDACRNNPFAEQGIVAPGLARASGGAGLLYAYSTDPGNVAYDGDGENSQFTAALLRHLDTPGLDVRLMFGRVRQNVILETNGAQIPWVEDSVIGEHSFSMTRPQPPSADVAREIERWREISMMSGTEPYEEFIAEFPDGIFREFAEQRISNPVEPEGEITLAALDDASRPAVVTALSVLGYLAPPEKESGPDEKALQRAVQIYSSQAGLDGDEFDTGRLYMDAARTLSLLGAKTAQRLRTDMAMLAAVERAAGMAEDALDEIRALAETHPEAKPVLLQATADVREITERQKKLHEQLDAGREYYSELLETARGRFEPLIRNMVSTIIKEERTADRQYGQHASDLGLFVNHIAGQHDSETEGSYAWMVDFLPE